MNKRGFIFFAAFFLTAASSEINGAQRPLTWSMQEMNRLYDGFVAIHDIYPMWASLGDNKTPLALVTRKAAKAYADVYFMGCKPEYALEGEPPALKIRAKQAFPFKTALAAAPGKSKTLKAFRVLMGRYKPQAWLEFKITREGFLSTVQAGVLEPFTATPPLEAAWPTVKSRADMTTVTARGITSTLRGLLERLPALKILAKQAFLRI